MRVSELIEKLSAFDGDVEVKYNDNEYNDHEDIDFVEWNDSENQEYVVLI